MAAEYSPQWTEDDERELEHQLRVVRMAGEMLAPPKRCERCGKRMTAAEFAVWPVCDECVRREEV